MRVIYDPILQALRADYSPTGPTGPTGSGTTDFITKWSSSTVLGNSDIYNSGGLVGIGVTSGLVAKLGIISTTEQLRLGYSASIYESTTVAATTGVVTRSITGGSGAAFVFSNSLGVGITPTARIHAQGTGSTSATFTIKLQNSSTAQLFNLADNGQVGFGSAPVSTHAFNITDIGAADSTRYVFNCIDSLGTNNMGVSRTLFYTNTIRQDFYALTGSGASNYYIAGNWVTNFFSSDYAGASLYKMEFDGNRAVFTNPSNAGIVYRSQVGIGLTAGTGPEPCSILELKSTAQGLLLCRMTTGQKNAIGTPLSGLLVYDSTLGKACLYGAAGWETITSV